MPVPGEWKRFQPTAFTGKSRLDSRWSLTPDAGLSQAMPSLLLPARPAGEAIRAAFLADESDCVQALLPAAALSGEAVTRVEARARGWVEAVRAHQARNAGMQSFLQQYDLSSQEGVLLMCVAEALLRIPDAQTADKLIRDKLSQGDWERHLGQSQSLLVNASTWGLMLTGRLTQTRHGQRARSRPPGSSASSRAPASRSCAWRFARR